MILMEKMKKLIACPIDWEMETGRQDWRESVLEFDWQRTLRRHAVRAEEVQFNPDLQNLYEHEPEPEIVIENLTLARSQAKKKYHEQAGRLAGLIFQTPSKHGKHYVPNLDHSTALSRTRNGRSLFFCNYDSAKLRNVYWTWFFQFFQPIVSLEDYEELVTPDSRRYRSAQGGLWKRFLHCHQLRLGMKTSSLIGACEGEETSYVCFDVHVGSKTVHCFPIGRADASEMMGDDGIIVVDS